MGDIRNLKFQQQQYPEVVEVINRLAQLEGRKPHDTAKRLILQCGKERIAALTQNNDVSCQTQSAEAV